MFLGHYAVALGAKRFAPRASLGTLLIAAQFIDLLWPTLLLLGIETVRIDPGATHVTPLDFVHYPYSHSLAAVLLWGGAFGLVYFYARRDAIASLVIGTAVVSHWLLDAIVHRPDLPPYPGSRTFIGLGVWSLLPATLVIEMALLAIGTAMYFWCTRAVDATGRWAAWILIALLVAIYLANVFGPPPPSVAAIAWVGQAQWLFVAWAFWIDRHRRSA